MHQQLLGLHCASALSVLVVVVVLDVQAKQLALSRLKNFQSQKTFVFFCGIRGLGPWSVTGTSLWVRCLIPALSLHLLDAPSTAWTSFLRSIASSEASNRGF